MSRSFFAVSAWSLASSVHFRSRRCKWPAAFSHGGFRGASLRISSATQRKARNFVRWDDDFEAFRMISGRTSKKTHAALVLRRCFCFVKTIKYESNTLISLWMLSPEDIIWFFHLTKRYWTSYYQRDAEALLTSVWGSSPSWNTFPTLFKRCPKWSSSQNPIIGCQSNSGACFPFLRRTWMVQCSFCLRSDNAMSSCSLLPWKYSVCSGEGIPVHREITSFNSRTVSVPLINRLWDFLSLA